MKRLKMKIIVLTKNKSTIVDDDVYEWASKLKWCFNNNYAVRSSNRIHGKQFQIYLHKEIMNAPKGIQVDHINGDKLDNRKENLRLCTIQENSRNYSLPRHNTSGYKGISWLKRINKWQAQISINNKIVYIGVYFNKEDAAKAYNEAAIKYHGDFAKLNEVD